VKKGKGGGGETVSSSSTLLPFTLCFSLAAEPVSSLPGMTSKQKKDLQAVSSLVDDVKRTWEIALTPALPGIPVSHFIKSKLPSAAFIGRAKNPCRKQECQLQRIHSPLSPLTRLRERWVRRKRED